MNGVATPTMEKFCLQHGVAVPFAVERIRAGRNSEVSRIHNRDGQWILKSYYRGAGDTRDRLGTEYGFLRYLQDAGVSGVPVPLGADHDLQLGLYSCLPGSRPESISPSHISQAAEFVGRINRRAGTSGLAAAADACVSWQDHIDLAHTRVVRLMQVEPSSPLAIRTREFVASRLLPCWTHLAAKLRDDVPPSDRAAALPQVDQILSPSDFGFHNTLEHAGALNFVDFEYGGWDDPAKLICDFICQPELPVTRSQGRQFMAAVASQFPNAAAVALRVEKLLPFHRLKWCCILLNEFRREDLGRRQHAGGGQLLVPLADQLAKARQYFDAHLGASD